uniref:DNA sulfur modification protein DndC n=1 Tax=Candidatus Kentrum sp. FM TaxID=2126340 RepID=A0A450W253_9GAMM|nr:MAG: DNA sulfur modification protein DndC [Candidatus Kentron sp. FM]VFJ58587.1 MAG: DNA sulfur modification protein DndC [Candidatus Kentron sp. FM]VFK11148.1 MAG: DNA sulfur modification protein DndC [Candidatus Kentron sp. FM]
MDSNEPSWRYIRQEIAEEYAKPHECPWIVGFSGGKDSTLVTHLVIEHMLSLPRSERRRPVHVVANDTLVESPLVINHIRRGLVEISSAATAFDLPVVTATTRPSPEQTFWVNLIGRGYPSPNRNFRWCTDRMKIQPTSQYVRSQAKLSGKVILLLGVRRSESATRAAMVKRYDNGERLNKHSDLDGCLVFRPIVELSTDRVWGFLAANRPPWGGSHDRLIKLYRMEILDRLLAIQEETGMILITDGELAKIRSLWVTDVLDSAQRNEQAQLNTAGGGR